MLALFLAGAAASCVDGAGPLPAAHKMPERTPAREAQTLRRGLRAARRGAARRHRHEAPKHGHERFHRHLCAPGN